MATHDTTVIAPSVHLELKKQLTNASDASVDVVLEQLGVTSLGLSESEALLRLAKVGRNEIASEKPLPWYIMLLKNFTNPFVMVLLCLSAISYATGDKRAVFVMALMVCISVTMRFIQEYRSSKAAEKLKAMVKITAEVVRRRSIHVSKTAVHSASPSQEIPMDQLVPGDIVRLSAGDMVPADLRLLQVTNLFIGQSALTGESVPVEKQSDNTVVFENPLERTNLCFLGTTVESGSATGVVISTGSKTYFGSIAKNLVGQRAETSFDIGVNKVSWILIRFICVMVPIVFIVNGLTKNNWQDAFLFAVAVAVGLTPEMLPVIVTTNLAKGALFMAKDKVVVKRIDSIQNLGAMDILCTDKTGTLTQNKVALLKYTDVFGQESAGVLEYAFINSFFQTGLANLLDEAVLEFAELEKKLELHNVSMIGEIPYDFERRRMSVVVQRGDEQLIVCKGAVEEIMHVCKQAEDRGKIIPFNVNNHAKALKLVDDFNEEGFRVIAVAYRKTSPLDKPYNADDERDLILAGFVVFFDPPKETASESVAMLHSNGVHVKIITGDNERVTRHVCAAIDLKIDGVVLGDQIDHLSDSELATVAEQANVFVKIDPDQKGRIIAALKASGHTVGYLGDGINDASALRASDVGISVDTAADIAKESSDIILLEKSLTVLGAGIIRGRNVYGNIIKYIKMTASSNFGNVLSVLVASVFLPFLPMLPIHLIIQNIFYDFSQLSIPWDTMDKGFNAIPRKWDAGGIVRFMLFIGPISSLFDCLMFVVMWFALGANTLSMQALFQSGWFVEGLLSQTLIVHMIRTSHIPFIQSLAARPVLLMTGTLSILGILFPFSRLGNAVGFVVLPPIYFVWLLGILLGYACVTQLVKTWYIKRFNSWL